MESTQDTRSEQIDAIINGQPDWLTRHGLLLFLIPLLACCISLQAIQYPDVIRTDGIIIRNRSSKCQSQDLGKPRFLYCKISMSSVHLQKVKIGQLVSLQAKEAFDGESKIKWGRINFIGRDSASDSHVLAIVLVNRRWSDQLAERDTVELQISVGKFKLSDKILRALFGIKRTKALPAVSLCWPLSNKF